MLHHIPDSVSDVSDRGQCKHGKQDSGQRQSADGPEYILPGEKPYLRRKYQISRAEKNSKHGKSRNQNIFKHRFLHLHLSL